MRSRSLGDVPTRATGAPAPHRNPDQHHRRDCARDDDEPEPSAAPEQCLDRRSVLMDRAAGTRSIRLVYVGEEVVVDPPERDAVPLSNAKEAGPAVVVANDNALARSYRGRGR